MTAVERATALSERDVLAVTLWAEGRSLKVLGRIGIGCAIRNRMDRRNQTAKTVCLAKLQFSCWWKAGGKANYDALCYLLDELAVTDDPIVRECRWIADGILSGACLDVTRGADHYLTTRLLGSSDRPTWVNAMTCTGVIEAHTFYRSA
jgi:N-acetylmuramoyl-L-alanine amidase